MAVTYRGSSRHNNNNNRFLKRYADVDINKKENKKLRGDPREMDEGLIKMEAKKQDNNLEGVYVPPFKLAQLRKDDVLDDKSSVAYQKLTWDALRKSINGLVNKVNATNIKNIVPELFQENLIRGRGLFCRSVIKSQLASPQFTHVFSALVSVVNSKCPDVGLLLLKRLVLQLMRAYKRNDKPQLLAATKFIAHLVNQEVAHELIALELLTVLLENPTEDSVKVAVGFVTDCGSLLQDLSPKALDGIFEGFRRILHEGETDKWLQFLIESLFAIRKAKFQGYPAVLPELDLVDRDDQLTHEFSLEDDEAGSDEESDDEKMDIRNKTETDIVNLQRTIYLTIMSSIDFEDAGHKLLQIKQYSTIHHLETCKLRNVAKFFAQLLANDALPWQVFSYVSLTEENTTSSSRIFIKILFNELSEHLGIRLLNERLEDPLMQTYFESVFPKDDPKKTRFCINFFTCVGLGGITESLREFLKMPRAIYQQKNMRI
ncbi:hypothetical protein IFM89_018802 [Coptis chinensis]|uniref:MIF4G domain-containing protein n=1 Tax=Coptis chinensis TaxID=261450 RepID=A0A835GY67_9MAGN|nr:hypothetical protein IFM89_018802 [Coptis chinensis]